MDAKTKAYLRQYAVSSTTEWMENQIAVFEKTARELRGYKARFEEVVKQDGKDHLSTPVNHLSYFVNAAACYPANNLRLDMAVNLAASLMATEPEK